MAHGDSSSPASRSTASSATSTTRIVAVASGKGGAGKTSAAVNLAWALGARGRRVCLLDADLGLSNVDILLGIEPQKTLEDVIFEGLSMERAAMNVGPGVDVISGSSGVQRMAELTRKERTQLTREFAKLSAYDYLIIDNSPGITAQVVSICLSSEEVILVVNPEATSVTDAYALFKVLKENGLWKSPLLLLNRCVSQRQARAMFEKFSDTGKRFLNIGCRWLGAVPDDPSVSRAVALRMPVVQADRDAPAAKAFIAAAAELDMVLSRTKIIRGTPWDFFDASIIRLKQGPLLVQDKALLPSPELVRDFGLVETMFGRLASAHKAAPVAKELTKIGRALSILKRRYIHSSGASPFEPSNASETLPAPPEPDRPRRAVLVCADTNMLEVLAELARDAGFEAAVAVESASEAKQAISEADMLLISGEEVGRTRAELDALLAVAEQRPVVFIESFLGRSDFAAANADKLAVVVQRPFRIGELMDVLRRFA